MQTRPMMQSIWSDFLPDLPESCDSDIVEITWNAKPIAPMFTATDGVGDLKITFDITRLDAQDAREKTTRHALAAKGAYVFACPARAFLVGQAIKDIRLYPDIIRFDLVTTGALLAFECDSYAFQDLPL